MVFRSGKRPQFNITDITKQTFAADVFFLGEIDLEKHISLRKKTSLAREHKRRNICNFSRTDFFFLFFVKMDKIRKGSVLRKEKWGSLSIQESKIAAMFSKRLSIHTVTILEDGRGRTFS